MKSGWEGALLFCSSGVGTSTLKPGYCLLVNQ